MSVQSHFNRYGIPIEEARKNKAAREKQTISRSKPPRPHDSYRGAKTSRVGYRGKWGIPNDLTPQGRVVTYSEGFLNIPNLMSLSNFQALRLAIHGRFKGFGRKKP